MHAWQAGRWKLPPLSSPLGRLPAQTASGSNRGAAELCLGTVDDEAVHVLGQKQEFGRREAQLGSVG